MRTPFLFYRVFQEGADWRWEIIENFQIVAYGYEKTSVAARVQAMIFALRAGTAVAER